jgi:hypothetical protein
MHPGQMTADSLFQGFFCVANGTRGSAPAPPAVDSKVRLGRREGLAHQKPENRTAMVASWRCRTASVLSQALPKGRPRSGGKRVRADPHDT